MTYDKYLAEQCRDDGQDTRELLLKMKNRLTNQLEAQIAEVEQIEKQIAAGQTLGERLEQLKEKVELTRKKLEVTILQVKEVEVSTTGPRHQGFNFKALSPASRGVSVRPPLPAALLLGGCCGALVGLIPAGLMIAVFRNRR